MPERSLHKCIWNSISMGKACFVLWTALAFSTAAFSAPKKTSSSPIISNIEVSGNRKIETDAIVNKLKSKRGQALSEALISEDVAELFRLGYFYNIEVFRQPVQSGVSLEYRVVEKPSVIEIDYEGNAEIKDDDLKAVVSIKPYEILSADKVRESVEKIQKAYEDKGYFLARIDPQIVDVKQDETVKLTFQINENEKVKVKKISFLGNRKLKEGFLKDQMATKEGGFFSFMSGSGSYKQEVFDRDMQILRFLYFNEGYVQVKIDRPQVYVTPDKKGIYITIRIEEGDQFFVGDIDFAGDILFAPDELRSFISIDESKIFSYQQLQKDLGELQAKYGDLGYAFANIIPRTRINEKEQLVDVTFEFDKGSKVYFGQFTVVGNSKTRDKVVRRELRIFEGELYNETAKRRSIENVQRLGYFEEVNFKTSTPADNPDLLNIDIVVKERNTGSIQAGMGYGSSTGLTFNGQVNQSNFLGKGQRLGASLEVNSRGNFFNLNFTDPYFRDTDWTVGYDLYQRNVDHFDYSQNVTGGAVRIGHPIGDNISAFLRYKYDDTKLKPVYDTLTGEMVTDYTIFPLETATGGTSSLTGTIEYDIRNDRFSPSKGMYASASLEYAGLGGNLKYLKGLTSFRYFQKLFWDVVWRNNLTYGSLNSLEDGVEPPFNERFLLGGPYSLRGFRFFRVGKRVYSEKYFNYLVSRGISTDRAKEQAYRSFGGKQQLYYSLELEFPLIAEAGIKGVTFYDIGQAEDSLTSENFYSNVGFGFRWFSPIGPLRFEWGFPLNRDPIYHEPSNFEFSIGTPF